MKPYTVTIDIDVPRERVIELFDNPDNLGAWQTGFVSFENVEGEPGEVGAISKIKYKHGKREFELIETVTERNLPETFNGNYEWGGGFNTLENHFTELGPDKTRWESKCVYELRNPMLKLMGFLMPGMFKKQNMKYLENFKRFCEHGTDIRNA